jgi:mannose-6-phosphate isomerase-like protein (cupin superfamily)
VTTVPHPYRTALENRDPAALYEALHPDVVFDTPAFEEAIEGRDNVLALFGVLAAVLEQPEIMDELTGNGSHAIVFRVSVEGHPIQGVDYLQLDEDGQVRRITVSMRPLGSVQVLAERMADSVANLTQEVRDPVTGYRVTFERKGEDLIIHTRVRPGGGPPPHVHPNGEEHFFMESGQVEFLLGRRKRIVGPGDRLVVPRGTRHTFKNVGSTEAVFRADVRPEPSGHGEDFFRETAAAARAGMYTRRGLPTGLRAALHLLAILERYQDFTLISNPPRSVQRLLFPLARRFG